MLVQIITRLARYNLIERRCVTAVTVRSQRPRRRLFSTIMHKTAFEIRPFQPRDQAGVVRAFTEFSLEFDMPKEWVDQTIETSVGDVEKHFMNKKGCYFWCAVLPAVNPENGSTEASQEVIGMVGVQPMMSSPYMSDAAALKTKAHHLAYPVALSPRESTAELMRMGVVKSARRMGVARQLLQALEIWCSEQGYTGIYCGTETTGVHARRFYLDNGFSEYVIARMSYPPAETDPERKKQILQDRQSLIDAGLGHQIDDRLVTFDSIPSDRKEATMLSKKYNFFWVSLFLRTLPAKQGV